MGENFLINKFILFYRDNMKKIQLIICIVLLFNGLAVTTSTKTVESDVIVNTGSISSDFDPLVDIIVTFDVLVIRALDKIDKLSDPDFFVKVIINNEEFTSPTWINTNYLYDCWSVTKNVPDEEEFVDIKIQLWDWNKNNNKICDISKNKNNQDEGFDISITYDIKTGRWYGDDYNIGDTSGYGRVCGTGDGSIYKDENDCELWFNIHQNDYDNDGLPYWVETYVYGTDPNINNTGEDNDEDGVPIEWEHKWGFNPNIWEDHGHFDPDGDSINNIEEFLSSNFHSDPYRKDVFLEIDFMEDGPKGQKSIVPEKAKELLKNPFHRQNIVFHLDTGEVCGGEVIPYDKNVKIGELLKIYQDYFLHNDENNWRRGVFHYGIVVYHCNPAGFAFSGDVSPYYGYIPGTNGFIISSKRIESYARTSLTTLEYYYASAIMHEMGHNFGMRWGEPFGCDSQLSKYPWQIGYWFYRNYKSIMNYRYTYKILDYSDGSHGRRDHNDWKNLGFSYFEFIES